MAMKPRAMKKKPMRGGGMMPRKMKEGGDTSDPAWLRAMKKEAEKLGIPLRELLTKSTKPAAKEKKTMKAKRGGMAKKKMMRGGAVKKK